MVPQNNRKKLIVLAGPTAVGKTSLAIELAKRFDTEIISCDSRQVYEELNIGVARPSPAELSEVKHYFIASRSIHQPYNAGEYAREVKDLLPKLFERNDTVIMTGGTGLYIKAVVEGFDNPANNDQSTREELKRVFEKQDLEGIVQIAKRLNITDSELLKNPQRLMRAIEIESSKDGSQTEITRNPQDYEVSCFFLNRDRDELYQRINQRVDQMMKDGFLEEAKAVYSHRQLNALQTVGYKELFGYVDGDYTLERAIELIKQKTRNYAKRQLTWFRNQGNFTEVREIGEILSTL